MKKIFFFISLVLTLCASLRSSAQSYEYALKLTQKLSAPEMWGRGYSHRGDSLAAECIRAEMRHLGVLPLADDYLQHYTMGSYAYVGDVSLSVNGRILAPYDEFRILPGRRYAADERLAKSKHKRQVDGVWFVGVDKLDTYSPLAGFSEEHTATSSDYCVEVLNSTEPKKFRKVEFARKMQYVPVYQSQNVCGYIRGEVDTMVVFTAHYDHCGTMGDNVIFYGAHDNASGVAAVLDVARMSSVQKPHYTMVFMLFSGEEAGLKGSKYGAEHPIVDLSKVRLLVNLDMFCGGADGFAIVNGKAENTAPFVSKITSANERLHYMPEIRLRDNAANSDHYWFSEHCPSIFIYTMGGNTGEYHSPYDNCDHCNLQESYEKVMALILESIK